MNEKAALIIIDMVKDTFDPKKKLKIASYATKIIHPINSLSAKFRENGLPVIFATDSFREDDFIFSGKMEPTSLEGTKGAEVIDELDQEPEDLVLPKRRFSSFLNTRLELWLRKENITLCAFAGIATQVCVLTSAMDAICYDFKAVIISDCSAAYSKEIHEQILNIYRHTPLYPLLRVVSSDELVSDLKNYKNFQ